MAASAKQYTLFFQLTAALGANFSKSFKNASSTIKTLETDLKGANKKIQDVSAYQKQQVAVTKSAERVDNLQKKYDELVEKSKKADGETKSLQKEIERCEKALVKAKDAAGDETKKLEQMSQALKTAGVNTDNLSQETGELKKQYERLEETQKKVQAITEKQAANKEAISRTKVGIVKTTAAILALGTALYAGPVKSAMAFESNMSEVAKVVDWLKDETGATTKEYTQLKNEIQAITTQIPMTAEEITQIMAAAGQSNVAKNNKELVEFTKSAAKMGIAFDTSSDQAGEWMAKWRTSFGMNQQQVIELSDKINYLGNTSAANAMEISSIITKIGPLGDVAGLASGEIAALGATLVSTGVQEDVAATGIKNLMLAMVQGESITKRQGEVLKRLGVNSKDLAKRMQTDAKGAIIDFLNAVKKLPEAEQAAALKDYFGKESVTAIAPLLTNLGYLEEQFNKVGDASLYAGSMEAEYAARADTTENKVQLAKNSIAALSTTLGDVFLPYVGKAAEKITQLIIKFTEFAQKNPGAVKAITVVVTSLLALKTAGLVAKLGFLEVKGGILSVQKAFTLIKGLGAKNYLSSLGGAFKGITGAGPGIIGYFRNIGGAAKGVGTAFGGVLNSSKIFTKLSGILGGIGGRAGSLFTATGGKLLSALLQPFTLLGGKLGGILSSVGGVIARSPLGMIGRVIGAGFGKITAFIAPVGRAVMTMLGPLGKLGTTILGPLGGVVGKILPIVGVITAIITVVKLFKNHLEEIRGFIQRTFGDKALAVFDKIVATITNVGNVIKNIFSDSNLGAARSKIQELFGDKGTKVFDTLVSVLKTVKTAVAEVIGFITTHVVPVAEQVLQVIISDIVPGIIGFVKAAAPTIMAIIQNVVSFIGAIIPIVGSFVAALMPIISKIISFIQTYVFPVISQIFTFITSIVLPAILAAIQAVLPVVVRVLSVLLPFIQNAITTIWNIVAPIIQGILAVVQAVMPVILAVIQSVIGSISGIIQNLVTIIGGVIDFITGVFTGNWTQAWEGVKSIFSGIFGGLGEIFKAPIKVIVSAINTVIGGLNKLKVPDWVPGLGGKGINIPLIPGFWKGTNRTPDTFIAGEKGPELVTGAANRKVFTAAQTGQIFNNMTQAGAVKSDSGVNARLGGGMSTIILKVENNPSVIVQNGDTNGIKQQLASYDDEFLEKIRKIIISILKEQRGQEERVAYV